MGKRFSVGEKESRGFSLALPSGGFQWVGAWGAVMCQVLPCQQLRAARKAPLGLEQELC